MQIKGKASFNCMTLHYFTELSKMCKGLWTAEVILISCCYILFCHVQIVQDFFKYYSSKLENDTLTSHRPSLSHFSERYF